MSLRSLQGQGREFDLLFGTQTAGCPVSRVLCEKRGTSADAGNHRSNFLLRFRTRTAYCIYNTVNTGLAVEFTWDARKARLNRRKHGISFDTARRVFDDPHHLSTQDREVDGEPRWQTMGMVEANVLLVAHTAETDDEVDAIRIISARKATRTERRIYAESHQKIKNGD